jgi:HAD superfamily hydrolase (TIGR01509 family)
MTGRVRRMGGVVRGLIFDFDGLILDTELPIFQSWSEIYRRHGQELAPDFWQSIVGRGSNWFDPVADLESRLGVTFDRERLQAERKRRQAEMVAALTVLPGVVEWRAEARGAGVGLGVASSSVRSWVLGHLERLGLDGWACVRCRDDVARPKPAPDVYFAVLECLGVAPEEAIAVEDSTFGVEAAKEAGCYCVAVPSSMTVDHDLSRADLVLPSLADVTFAEVAGRL